MYTHRRNFHKNENKLKTISLEPSSGKVDPIFGNETNSELWKASVLLLKWRKSTLTACLELDVFTLIMWSSQMISYLPQKHPTTNMVRR